MPKKVSPEELAEFIERVVTTDRDDRDQTRAFLTRGDVEDVLQKLETDIREIDEKE